MVLSTLYKDPARLVQACHCGPLSGVPSGPSLCGVSA